MFGFCIAADGSGCRTRQWRRHSSTSSWLEWWDASASCIVDFYGMVESVGIIFPDCPQGNKHAPVFGDVIVRNPLTLEPVAGGEHGIVQVCSVLPTSFPATCCLQRTWLR